MLLWERKSKRRGEVRPKKSKLFLQLQIYLINTNKLLLYFNHIVSEKNRSTGKKQKIVVMYMELIEGMALRSKNLKAFGLRC